MWNSEVGALGNAESRGQLTGKGLVSYQGHWGVKWKGREGSCGRQHVQSWWALRARVTYLTREKGLQHPRAPAPCQTRYQALHLGYNPIYHPHSRPAGSSYNISLNDWERQAQDITLLKVTQLVRSRAGAQTQSDWQDGSCRSIFYPAFVSPREGLEKLWEIIGHQTRGLGKTGPPVRGKASEARVGRLSAKWLGERPTHLSSLALVFSSVKGQWTRLLLLWNRERQGSWTKKWLPHNTEGGSFWGWCTGWFAGEESMPTKPASLICRNPNVRWSGQCSGAEDEVLTAAKERSKQDTRNTSKATLRAFGDWLEE